MKTIHAGTEQQVVQLEQQLRVKERELNSLLQITQAVNNNISSQGLLRIYENLLVNEIGVGRVAVFIHSEQWECTNAYGIELNDAEEKISKYLPSFLQITRLENTSHPLAKHFDVVVPVFHKDFPLAFTLLGDFRKEAHFALEEKLNYIQTISNVIGLAIENKRLFRAQASQMMLKSDLELAGQMQTMLIPGKLPDDEKISIAGVYLPHQEVGGDYYDYIELNDEEFIFCIGDISGKGIAAALLMANFQASVRSYAEQQPSLEALIHSLNARVNEITNGEKFITFFIAKYNLTTHEFQYVNAGHNPAILYYEGQSRLLQEGCTILGMFEKLPYVNVQRMVLEHRFITFCYTDGLTDIENENKQPLDIADIISFIEKNNSLSPSKLNKKIVDHLVAFKGNRLISDDISMLTCLVH